MGTNNIRAGGLALSGQGLRRRMDAAELAAVGAPTPTPTPKKKKKKQKNLITPKQEHADARAAENARLTAVDDAIIEARGLRSGK